MEIQNVLDRIITKRQYLGYSLDYMATDLNITPASYRKIEMGETKLTLERLYKIADLLKSSVAELLDITGDYLNQNNSANENVYQQKIEHFYQENKETFQRLIKSYEERLSAQENEISFLRTLIQKK